MGVENFLNYNSYIEVQNQNLNIWGQPCTIFIPENQTALGYEGTHKDETDLLNADSVLSNRYRKYSNMRIWINFTVTKNVFYRFNWFPDDADELCISFMSSNSFVHENAYVRTSVPGQKSIWGDMIFQVVKIQDVGLSQTLQRMYFLKPVSSAELYKVLDVGEYEKEGDDKMHVSTSATVVRKSDEYVGAMDYNKLANKPSINGIELLNNKSTDDLEIDTIDKFTDALGSDINLGGITKGEKFDKTAVAEVLRKMLHPYKAPELSVKLNIDTELIPVGTVIEDLAFTVTVTKNTEKVEKCIVIVDGIKVYIDTDIAEGGTFEYHYTKGLSSNAKLQVIVSDNQSSVGWDKELKWTSYSYIGLVEDNVEIEPSVITELNKMISDTNTYIYSDISIDYGRVVYAYPKSLGKLLTIIDGKTKWDLSNSFTQKEILIGDVEYYLYYLTDSAGFTSATVIFRG